VVRRPHTRPVTAPRQYRYIGPAEHRARPPGSRVLVDSPDAVTRWLAAQERSDRSTLFTYVVDLPGGSGSPRDAANMPPAPTAPTVLANQVKGPLPMDQRRIRHDHVRRAAVIKRVEPLFHVVPQQVAHQAMFPEHPRDRHADLPRGVAYRT
jgi:hypothetical protein